MSYIRRLPFVAGTSRIIICFFCFVNIFLKIYPPSRLRYWKGIDKYNLGKDVPRRLGDGAFGNYFSGELVGALPGFKEKCDKCDIYI